jgi:hypothetical protein
MNVSLKTNIEINMRPYISAAATAAADRPALTLRRVRR